MPHVQSALLPHQSTGRGNVQAHAYKRGVAVPTSCPTLRVVWTVYACYPDRHGAWLAGFNNNEVHNAVNHGLWPFKTHPDVLP